METKTTENNPRKNRTRINNAPKYIDFFKRDGLTEQEIVDKLSEFIDDYAISASSPKQGEVTDERIENEAKKRLNARANASIFYFIDGAKWMRSLYAVKKEEGQ